MALSIELLTRMRCFCLFLMAGVAAAALAPYESTTNDWNPRAPFLASLVKHVPKILQSQDRATGRFGTAPWNCRDQEVIFPLAAVWTIEDPSNPYYHNADVLEAIMKGGDALIADQDRHGAWTFRKKDNSTWGQILMPWTYSRWIRAFALVKDAMPPARRQHWEKGLRLGFDNISWSCLGGVDNIATHHAMALYCAGECLGHEDWKRQAQSFLAKVVAAQAPGGWWSEHSGPVVGYNAVYVDALGVYYAMSHDPVVLEALRRSAVFHATFVYPDGNAVETVDERNPFHAAIDRGNIGLSATPEGRGYLRRQYELCRWSVSTDEAASFLINGTTGPAVPPAGVGDESMTIVGNNEALVLRHKPWFICLSAFTCKQSTSRWIQDRQNFVSIFHDGVGLILGGGNTKLQPFWSNFTVGDTSLLSHRPGDEDPSFRPKGGLVHMPSAARLRADTNAPGLDLTCGGEDCRITVLPKDDTTLTLVCEASRHSGQPVEGHLTFLPHVGGSVVCASGKTNTLGEAAFEWTVADTGAWFEHHGVRVNVPTGARLAWPKKRHDPYTKDGHSHLSDARLVLCLPFTAATPKYEVALEIKSLSDK